MEDYNHHLKGRRIIEVVFVLSFMMVQESNVNPNPYISSSLKLKTYIITFQNEFHQSFGVMVLFFFDPVNI